MFSSKKVNAFIEKYKLKPQFFYVRSPREAIEEIFPGRNPGDPIATVCVLELDGYPTLSIGVSMRNPDDPQFGKQFNKERGREIALGRAFYCFKRNGQSRDKMFIRGLPMFVYSPLAAKIIKNLIGNKKKLPPVEKEFFFRWGFVQDEAMKFYDKVYAYKIGSQLV